MTVVILSTSLDLDTARLGTNIIIYYVLFQRSIIEYPHSIIYVMSSVGSQLFFLSYLVQLRPTYLQSTKVLCVARQP